MGWLIYISLCSLLPSSVVFAAFNPCETCDYEGAETFCPEKCNKNVKNQTHLTDCDFEYAEVLIPLCAKASTASLKESKTSDVSTCSEKGKEGRCVEYNQCNSYDQNSNYGFGIITESSVCKSNETCCPIRDIKNVTDASSKASETFPNCGEANPIFKLMVDEGQAYLGEFPWMLYIYTIHTKTLESIYLCGGSLIHPKVALTAAHKVRRIIGVANKQLFVRGGETDVDDPDEYLSFVKIKVSKIIIHDDFNSSVLFNDVALLILDKPFKNAPHINAICLPPPGEILPQKNCISTGWGKSAKRKDGNYQNVLKKIELPTILHADCNNALKKTKLGSTFILHESFMCAGGIEGRDTCEGDGGSPLICPFPNNPKRFMQVGIVAWGIDCGENNIPGVYANIPYLRGWIDKQLKSNQIEIAKDS